LAGELIVWSGISASILIIAVLVLPRENTALRANRYLAGFVAIMAIRLVVRYLFLTGVISSESPSTLFGLTANLFAGPCLLFYLLGLTKTQHPFHWHPGWHWLPGIIGLCASLILSLLDLFGTAPPIDMDQQQFNLVYIAVNTPPTLSLLGYGLLGLHLLKQHRRHISDQFSSLERINLNWLKWICWFLIAAAASLLIQSPDAKLNSYWQGIIYAALLYYIGYMGICQPVIFRQNKLDSLSSDEKRPEQPVADAPPRQLPGDSERIWQLLQQLFESEAPYRQHNINLARLAERLNVPPYRLSAVINHHGQCNFFDLINGQRVEHAKRLLMDKTTSFSILDIAMESGFNSKSTFYSQFKKFTGLSPSVFRKQH